MLRSGDDSGDQTAMQGETVLQRGHVAPSQRLSVLGSPADVPSPTHATGSKNAGPKIAAQNPAHEVESTVNAGKPAAATEASAFQKTPAEVSGLRNMTEVNQPSPAPAKQGEKKGLGKRIKRAAAKVKAKLTGGKEAANEASSSSSSSSSDAGYDSSDSGLLVEHPADDKGGLKAVKPADGLPAKDVKDDHLVEAKEGQVGGPTAGISPTLLTPAMQTESAKTEGVRTTRAVPAEEVSDIQHTEEKKKGMAQAGDSLAHETKAKLILQDAPDEAATSTPFTATAAKPAHMPTPAEVDAPHVGDKSSAFEQKAPKEAQPGVHGLTEGQPGSHGLTEGNGQGLKAPEVGQDKSVGSKAEAATADAPGSESQQAEQPKGWLQWVKDAILPVVAPAAEAPASSAAASSGSKPESGSVNAQTPVK